MLQPSHPSLHCVSLCFSWVLVLLRCYSPHAPLHTVFLCVFQLGLVEMLQPSRPALHCASMCVLAGPWSCWDVTALTPCFTLCLSVCFSWVLVLLRCCSPHALLYTVFLCVFQLGPGLVEMLQPSRPALRCVSLCVSAGFWSCWDVAALTPRFTLCFSVCFSWVLVLLRRCSHHPRFTMCLSVCFSWVLVWLRCYSHHTPLHTVFLYVFQLGLGLVEMLQPSRPALHCVSLRVSAGSCSCWDVTAITPRFTLCFFVFQLGLGLVEMLQPSRPASLGVLALTCAPSEGASTLMIQLAELDLTLSVTVTSVNNFAGVGECVGYK